MSAARREPGFGPRFALPVLLGPSLNPINTTMIAVALTPIAQATGVSSATVVWLVAGLYLVSSVAQPVMGRIADVAGPKRVYLAGLLIVIVAGLLPTILPTFVGVLLARLLIGLGTSAAYPSAMTLIKAQSVRLGRTAPQALLSGLSISSLVTAAIGPVLGGVLISLYGWQSIFLVNVPLAALALVTAWLWLPGDERKVASEPRPSLWSAIDPLGIALFAVTIVAALVFVLDLSAGLYALLAIVVVAGAGFVWWELRARSPFIDLRMLASHAPLVRTFTRLFLVYVPLYLVVYSTSQWLQTDVGLAPGAAGLTQLPSAVLAGAASILIARSMRVWIPLVVAAAVPIVGSILIIQLHADTALWLVLLATALFGVPQGLASISNQAALYRQAPAAQIGVAAGLSRTAIQLGAIIASGIVGVAFGDEPSDAGLHAIGAISGVLVTFALAVTVFDRPLRRMDRSSS